MKTQETSYTWYPSRPAPQTSYEELKEAVVNTLARLEASKIQDIVVWNIMDDLRATLARIKKLERTQR